MNAPVTAQATEAAQIEAALDALLTAAIKADRDRSLMPERGPVSAGAMIGEALERRATWTPAQEAAHDLLRRPVAWALRNAVRTLGKRLFEIGGLKLMSAVCDRVSALDPANEGRRAGIIDHRWDGIGSDQGGRWWA